MKVPFFRPELTEEEIAEVVDTLRSGWLTSGPKVRAFESEFAVAVGARHALSVNSCTAALHLAVEALGLRPGDAVLVPTMTFAASAEIVRYQGATPILVDCDPHSLQLDFDDAQAKIEAFDSGRLLPDVESPRRVVGILPVHVGGVMLDLDLLHAFAERHRLWTLEDAAHSFPAAWRRDETSPWIRCGENSATVTCFSFYANKTLTTGEGGMAVTTDDQLAERMRLMSLHGLSKDAWDRYTTDGKWDYQIVAPGFKYNLTDIAAALGLHQLRRAEQLRLRRQEIALRMRAGLASIASAGDPGEFDPAEDDGLLELPLDPPNRIHAWHLFPIQLQTDRLSLDRNQVIRELNRQGVGTSVHWRPLHLHPYYRELYDWQPEQLPAATQVFERNITLPLFPAQREEEVEHVIATVRSVLEAARQRRFTGFTGCTGSGPVDEIREEDSVGEVGARSA